MYHSKFPVAPRWIAKARIEKWKVALFASAGFVALFGFFLYGSFIGQTEMRECMMTWIIKPISSSGMKESEVVHSFVDFLSYYKRKIGEEKVKVVFEVTLD